MTLNFNQRFFKGQDGSMFAGGLILLIAMFVVGGFALDVSNAVKTRAELQATADAVAHAAIYDRNANSSSADVAKAKALAVAEVMMPSSRNGIVLTAADIKFGIWNAATRTFTPLATSKSAVLVDTSRLEAKANGLSTYLLKFAGIDYFDVVSQAVYETYRPICMREGFVADKVVDLQSNNSFSNRFCLHANGRVEMNNNNSFEARTVVSMPSTSDLVIPSDGFSKNPGLETALQEGTYSISILNDLAAMIEDLRTGGAIYKPSYIIPDSKVIQLRGIRYDPADFTRGRIHYVACGGGATLRFEAGGTYENFVLVTNCEIAMPSNINFFNVTIATTDTGADSITAAAQLALGAPDNCAEGGGSKFLTLGGIKIAAALQVHGSQMIARRDISFTALGHGFYGASLIAGGNISGTSNMNVGFCNGAGTGDFYLNDYFRLVL